MTPAPGQQLVRMGEIAVARGGGTLAALGLGSCVAVLMWDSVVPVGALAHVLLPSHALSRQHDLPGRAADTAIPAALERVVACGADRRRVTAKLVGGASMFADLLAAGTVHIGERNIVACRMALREAGISVVAESVGGEEGRSVWFDVVSGRVTVRSAGHEPNTI